MKTAELTGAALDWAVACAKGMSFPSLKFCEYPDDHPWVLFPDGTIRSAWEIPSNAMSRQYDYTYWSPSADWAQGGLIIERERISIRYWANTALIHAYMPHGNAEWGEGSTPLIAAMRCFVASKLGDEVDIPKELMS